MDTVPLENWFDPDDERHLRAYQHLRDKGCWPEGFIPDNVEMSAHWVLTVTAKLADAWVRSRLN
jgi:hypothetical protein